VKRSIYAETRREKMELISAVHSCEWNAEANPILVTLPDNVTVEHDFSNGPCRCSVNFTLRNFSMTNSARYILQLAPENKAHPPDSDLLPSAFTGRMTLHGSLEPSEQKTVPSQLWISRSGNYSLADWRLETEVLEGAPDNNGNSSVRQRYVQESSSSSRAFITVSDARKS